MDFFIQQLEEAKDLPLPCYMTEQAAGMDLCAHVFGAIVLKPLERAVIPCGFKMAMPPGFEAQIRPRSGLALKHGISIPNAPGTIDADYRGEIGVLLINLGSEDFVIRRGDRIAQMVISRVEQICFKTVDTLPESKRGEGGYGSTNKILAFFDRKDYNLTWPYIVRHSANAVIIKEDKLAMLYLKKHGIFVFPGGSTQGDETIIEALVRETREEAGLVVKPSSVSEIGKVIEIRKDMHKDEIYERHDFFYLCDAEDAIVTQSLSNNEIESGYQFVFTDIDKAILANEAHMQKGFKWTEGATHVLRHVKQYITTFQDKKQAELKSL